MKKTVQISESLWLGFVLALSGGFMDAYSYMCRGHVFANAQTGNILLFGVNLSTGDFQTALRYLFPVVAFSFGIAIADIVKHRFKNLEKLHWRQITILLEAIILLPIGFMPQSYNLLANSLTSFVCGIQVESFRKINGNGVSTTMCIGNLRAATQALCDYRYQKDKASVKRGILLYGVIGIFALGAVVGNICVSLWGEKAIIVSSVLLFIGFAMMFINGGLTLLTFKDRRTR